MRMWRRSGRAGEHMVLGAGPLKVCWPRCFASLRSRLRLIAQPCLHHQARTRSTLPCHLQLLMLQV